MHKLTFSAAFLGALTAASLAFGAGDLNGSRGADGYSSGGVAVYGGFTSAQVNAARTARNAATKAASGAQSHRGASKSKH